MRIQARQFAQVFGAVYIAVGILGFVFTGLSDFAAASGDRLLVFGVNPCTTSSTSWSARCGSGHRAAR